MKPLFILPAFAVALLVAPFSSSAYAQDEVIETAAGDEPGRRHNGVIVDYTGVELLLRAPTGRERSIPAERVAKITTRYTAEHRQAREFFDKGPAEEGKYAEAELSFRKAYAAEPRKWVKRMLLAGMTRCLFSMGQTSKAGEVFEALLRSDPQTLHFNAIPLVWDARQPSLTTTATARKWLSDAATPTSQLMAASWLLSSVDHRNDARTALAALKNSRDKRVAHLAGAQLWRLEMATATPDDIGRWQSQLALMPAAIQSGPYYVLGKAIALKGQHEAAAMAFMRPVILTPKNHTLLAPALRGAARSLEKLGRRDEAISLYSEIATRHPLSPYAGEASQRVKNLQ